MKSTNIPVLMTIVVGATLPSFRDLAAQEDSTRLEDIAVTATMVPVTRNAVASTLTVIDGDAVRAQGITTVADALRSVPGLHVAQSGSFGAVTSLFMRGGESDYVQVLIDGVPVNQPGGAYDFANLSTHNIDRIEVLRGPASVLYGSEATAGVIQILTRRGAGAPRLGAGIQGGSYGSVGLDAHLSGGEGIAGYAVGISHFLTDGAYDFNNDYDNTVLSGRIQLQPDARSDLALSLRYRDSKFHFPTDFAGNLVDRNAFTLDEATTVSVDAGRYFTDQVEVRVSLASNITSGGIDDSPDDAADTLGFFASRSLQDLSRQSADVRTNVYLDGGFVVTAGVEFEQQDERSFNESESEFGRSGSSTDVERSNRAYYAQLLADQSGFSGSVGARIDDNQEFGTFVTYRAAAAYRFASGTRVRGSVGRSFKAPAFFENFATGFVTGNPDLEPERSTSWEAGVEQVLGAGRATVAVTYFSQAFRDLIQFTFDDTPNFVNVAEANARGVEADLSVRAGRGFTVVGNVTVLHTEVVDAGLDTDGATFVEGERLLRRPTTTLNAGIDYDGWDRGTFAVRVNHVGTRDDRDFNAFPGAPIELPAYTTVDLSARIDVLRRAGRTPAVSWTLRVENVFDETYQSVFGFPNRGRTVMVGARMD